MPFVSVRRLSGMSPIILASALVAGTLPAAAGAKDSLDRFRSDSDLRKFLKKRQESGRGLGLVPVPVMAPPPAPMPAPPAPGTATSSQSDSIVVTGTSIGAFPDTSVSESLQRVPGVSITNNQEANVDEGGIVKMRGDTLVILRRGRIFTVSTAGGKMTPIDVIDAMPPGVKGDDDWYDEMLLHGDRVVVIGYSYGRGGTEVNRFRLSADGHLKFEDAYHLRSNDYYSSSNYASRLIGNHLIYYTPLDLDWDDDPLEIMPGMRRWRGDEDAKFKRIAGGRQTYIVPRMRNDEDANLETLHTVMDCDLTAREMACKATAVLGPESRNFYVSSDAIYLWVSDAFSDDAIERGAPASYVYRIPLREGEPTAVAVRGGPTDQFSFREDRKNRLLDVLVRSEGGDDRMWRPEVSEGDVALLSIPLDSFADGSKEVPLDRYRALPSPHDGWSFQNRFVGDFVLYGEGRPHEGTPLTVYFARLRGGPAGQIPLQHKVERIDILGRDAIVIGSSGNEDNLGFTAIDLSGRSASFGDLYQLPAASQGESRSHGFFYRPDNGDGSDGLLGLPIRRDAPERFASLFESSAAMTFLQRRARKFSPAGELAADVEHEVDDRCIASCVDWYGNARPIFVGGRIFALLGYELVEGRMNGGKIEEIGRVNYAPRLTLSPAR